MHEIESEILKITNYKVQRKFSDRQDYLKSVFNSVQKLSNDDFDSLTDEAATWANACVEAFNRDKEGDLPDFDELSDPEDDESDDSEESDSEDETEEETEESVDDPEDASENDEGDSEEDESEEVVAPKRTTKKPAKAAKAEPKKAKPKVTKKPEVDDEEEVELDKWGCMVGSKNSQALAMFEKGATTREIKETLGGTYYNILKRMVTHGHKLEKKGAVIKLIHFMEKASKISSPKNKSKK